MSFWDNVKKFTQPYADDYDDEYEDDYADDYEEPEEAPRRSRREEFVQSAPVEEPENDFGFNSDFSAARVTPAPTGGFSGQVVNMNPSSKQHVVLFRPSTFQDAVGAADDLRAKKAVIINMENVDKAMARRIVDFVSGCAYAVDGKVKKIAQSTYLFCPFHMDVEGDVEGVQSEVESYI